MGGELTRVIFGELAEAVSWLVIVVQCIRSVYFRPSSGGDLPWLIIPA